MNGSCKRFFLMGTHVQFEMQLFQPVEPSLLQQVLMQLFQYGTRNVENTNAILSWKDMRMKSRVSHGPFLDISQVGLIIFIYFQNNQLIILYLLATCSRDKSVWVWGIGDSCEEFECAAVLNLHTQDVKKVTWHPFLDILASASYDNTIKMFREDPTDSDWVCFATLQSHSSTVWSIAFDKTGDRLVSVSDDCTVKIWQQYPVGNEEGIPTPDNEPAWKCVCTLSGYHDRSIYDVAWCKLTGLIATACGDDQIRIFKESETSTKNEPTFELETRILAHKQDVNCVKWNPVVPGLLMSTSDDGDIKLWKFNF